MLIYTILFLFNFNSLIIDSLIFFKCHTLSYIYQSEKLSYFWIIKLIAGSLI